MSKKSRLKMRHYRPPKRESINDLLAIARRRVALPAGGWDRIGESFVRSLIKDGLLQPMVAQPKASGRGRAVRMTPRSYRDLLSILRLRALGVRRREWPFYLWVRGSPFPEHIVRLAAVESFKRIARTIQRDIAPTGRYGLPAQIKAQRAIDRDPDSDPTTAPFLAAAFGYMGDPKGTVDLNAIWAAVPAVMRDLGIDDTVIDAVAAARESTSQEQALAAVSSVLDFMREATGIDPAHPIVAQSITEVVNTIASGRYRSFIVDKYDRSRLLERLENAPWGALERARGGVQFTMNRPLDGPILMQLPQEVQPLAAFMRGQQATLAKIMRGSPWFVTLHFAIWVEDGAPSLDESPTRFT